MWSLLHRIRLFQFTAVATCSILQITEHLSRPNLYVLSSGTNILIRSFLLSSAICIALIFLGHYISNCPQSWRYVIWKKDSLQSFLGLSFQVTRATYERTDNWAVDGTTVWTAIPITQKIRQEKSLLHAAPSLYSTYTLIKSEIRSCESLSNHHKAQKGRENTLV